MAANELEWKSLPLSVCSVSFVDICISNIVDLTGLGKLIEYIPLLYLQFDFYFVTCKWQNFGNSLIDITNNDRKAIILS